MFYVCLLHDTAEYMAQPPDHLYFQAKVQVPRSGPAGLRTKDKDLDLSYTLNFVCHSPPLTLEGDFSGDFKQDTEGDLL